ncbi:MAG TPA: DUF4175 family protein [Gemmatimonas sp.]|nr:DUF4175 family protein [Gemmatimonas sp.]
MTPPSTRIMSAQLVVSNFLGASARRVRQLAVLRGATAGIGVAAIIALGFSITSLIARGQHPLGLLPTVLVAMACAMIGGVVEFLRTRHARAKVAVQVERRVSQFRNLLVTADELQRATPLDDAATNDGVAGLVMRQCAAIVATLDPASLFPAGRTVRNASLALGALAATMLIPAGAKHVQEFASRAAAVAAQPRDALRRIDVVVVPPAYTGRPQVRSTDPSRIEALVDSRVRVTVQSANARVRISSVDGELDVRPGAEGTHTATLAVNSDGFVIVESFDSAGTPTARRLIGITAAADVAPRVRMLAPARDLVLRDSAQTIALGVEADDDMALASLRLRYTKVSGSGERFTFDEGEVPLRVTRRSGRVWEARASWSLASLGLVPGDMVVYRAVATDRRPGGAPSESDAFIAQLFASEGDAAAGFAVDPDEERQALSQQMVILKSERLLAKQRTISPEAFLEEARNLAIEQRRVRAEFVFMMGGELAEAVTAENSMGDLDESHEAEAESDLSAGRMANQGRTALLAAIRAMSRAATALTEGDLSRALPQERAAVTQLEKAFARSRYLLRALTEREALDLSRRGSGALTDASRAVRPVATPERGARVTALRSALDELVAAGTQIAAATTNSAALDASVRTALPARLSMVAERVLRTNPSAPALQAIAEGLNAASGAIAAGRTGEARTSLDRASARLAAALREETIARHEAQSSIVQRRMAGALADRLRASGAIRSPGSRVP